MNYEEYGEVINGQQTYEGIAHILERHPILVGWTDGNGTHLDIMFNKQVVPYGTNIQGGIRPNTDLFVSIMRWGAFAFEISESELHPGYVDEKLGNRGSFGKACSQALAELINGVKKEILK